MNIEYELRGIRFRWNEDKAKLNIKNHEVGFEQAAQVFSTHSYSTRMLHAIINSAMVRWGGISIFGCCLLFTSK